MAVSTPSLFRPETFDLLAGEFATNLTYYRNYTRDDAIAGMFLGCALDIIDCTYYTLAKSMTTDRRKSPPGFFEGCRGTAFDTLLLEDVFAPDNAKEIVEHHGLLLDALREKYRWLVRGPRDICWSESSRSIAADRDTCRARSSCHKKGGDEAGFEDTCRRYFSSWRATMLAINDREILRDFPEALGDEIRSRCRVLDLLTTPEGLEQFLTADCGQREPGEEVRTVRGVIPRLLTMLVDESLGNLNRKMNLSPEEALYFSRPLA